MSLTNTSRKVALVTGAARRIGSEIAKELHQAGFNLLLHYNRSEQEALALCAELNTERPDSARVIPFDLVAQDDYANFIWQAISVWQRLDVLVNNASRFFATPMGSVTAAIWDELLISNLKAPFFLAQAAAPALTANHGVIINITDIHAKKPLKDHGVYCIAKAGLQMLTQVLAKELGPNVRVNAIAPGAIMWPEDENAIPEEIKARIIAHSFLKRSGEPSDIAKAVRYLVCDAHFVTGQTLIVDGGRSLA